MTVLAYTTWYRCETCNYGGTREGPYGLAPVYEKTPECPMCGTRSLLYTGTVTSDGGYLADLDTAPISLGDEPWSDPPTD